MKAVILILVVFFSGLSWSWADGNFDALEKLRKIPPASATISGEQFMKSSSLVLTARGAFINNSKMPVPFDQVLKALADLLQKAWPNGRVIIFYPFPPGPSNPGDEPLPSEVKKVEADLKAAGIQVEPGASA